jgi:hypothetical protein
LIAASVVGDAPVEDVVKDQRGALARRQYLHDAHEREPDALAQPQELIRRRHRRQQRIGVRLQPQDVGARRGRGRPRRDRRADVLRQHATRARLEHVEAGVGDDPVHPRAEARARFVRRERAPRLEP